MLQIYVLLVCVHCNADFILEMFKKLNDYFFTILLPEIEMMCVMITNKKKYCI